MQHSNGTCTDRRKVEPSVKKRIKSLVDDGKYRDMRDFTAKAIHEKLEREGIDEREAFKKQLIDLVRYDVDIRSALEAVVLATNIKFEE